MVAGPKVAKLKVIELKAVELKAAKLKVAGLKEGELKVAGLKVGGLAAAWPRLAAGAVVGGPLVLHNAANRGLAARTGLPLFAIDLGMKLKISPRLTGGIAVILKGGAPCGQCQVQGVDNGLV